MLHCLSQSHDSQAAQRLFEQLREGDSVLLLSIAVRLAASDTPSLDAWLDRGVTLFALEADLRAYAVQHAYESVKRVDYAGWVALSEQHHTQRWWR